ncbi:MAG TPA: hypothetical protein VGP82_08200 [Ktedonobacterales bacterium]|jgi:hypothetical protein|nr:hypothetical protein [Ktedonobacterales bacterium]
MGDDRSAARYVAGTRLSGRWLLGARIAWVLLFALALVPLLASLPSYLPKIEHSASDNAALPPGAVEALARAGISLQTYAWVSLVTTCVVVLLSVVIALLLVWRRGDDWMALLVSVFLVVYTTSNIGIPSNGPSGNPGSPSEALYAVLVSQQNVPAAVVPFAVFLLFPTGRFVPRWSRGLFVASTVWAFALTLVPELLGGLLILGYPLFIGAIIVCMIYRYRGGSTPVQRQQTKWVIAGLVISLVANQAFWLLTQFASWGETIYPPLSFLAYQLVLLLVPVTFFIAIQRYRLYEIDTLINRALVYGSLTVILALVYVAGVISLQALVGGLTGAAGQDGSPLAIVATTLLIAALFRPLRTRLQAIVDRRFYRSKYDAAKTLAAFESALRREVELAAVRDHLLAAVEETMLPAHASLWLREPERPGSLLIPAPSEG